MTVLLSVVAWLLTYVLHSTILLGGAWVLCGFGVVRSNAAKDTLWKVALVGGLLTATVQLALGVEPYAGNAVLTPVSESALIDVATRRTSFPAFPAAGRDRAAAAPSREVPVGQTFAASGAGDYSAVVTEEAPRAQTTASPRRFRRVLNDVNVSWPAALLQLWLFGALAFGLRLLVTRAGLARRLRLRRPVQGGPLVEMLDGLRASAGIRRSVRLSVSAELLGPIAFGRSEIVLPDRLLAELTPAEQRAVLAHELGHLVRRDPAWLALGAGIESLFFMQPLNRLARPKRWPSTCATTGPRIAAAAGSSSPSAWRKWPRGWTADPEWRRWLAWRRTALTW